MGGVRQIRATTSQLQGLIARVGGDHLKRVAREQLRHARGLVAHGRCGERTGRQLHLAVAGLAIEVGWLSHDAAENQQAFACYTDAAYLARLADSPVTEAWVYRHMGIQARAEGRTQETLRLAQRGSELVAHSGTPLLRALAAMEEAKAWSGLGDRAETQAAISRAWKHMEHATPSEQDPEWVSASSVSGIEVELRGGESICHSHLREFRPAAETLTAMMAESDGRSALADANRSARLALLRLALRDVDGACVAAVQALRPDVSSRRVRARVAEFATSLGRHQRTSVAADFLDRWRAWSRYADSSEATGVVKST